MRLGELLLETEVTVRALAKATGYSKSTVHKDLTERLPNVDAHCLRKLRKYSLTINQSGIYEAARQQELNG